MEMAQRAAQMYSVAAQVVPSSVEYSIWVIGWEYAPSRNSTV